MKRFLPFVVLLAVVACTASPSGSSDPSPITSVTTVTNGSTTLAAVTTVPDTAASTSTTTTIPATSTNLPAIITADGSGAPTGPPVSGPSGDPEGPLPPGAEVVTVASITDGDTIDVVLPSGVVATVRLIGTNSPESGECHGAESTLILAALIPSGSMMGLTRDVSDLDDFGRLLRYLWVGSMSVNEESVRRGAAISRHYPPDTAMSDRLDAAQDAARTAGVGLWSPTACGPQAEATLIIVDVFFDAPGDDNQNLNEEWVEIRNEGGSPVDLTGWGIKDESATHRYQFPASFTLASGESVTVRTGCGVDFGTELFWCNVGSAVWNNSGDTAFLLDPNGNNHDTLSYGESG